jgi:hypothetical protein
MRDAEFYAWNLGRRQQIYQHAAAAVAGCAVLSWAICGFGGLVIAIETAF